MLICQNSDKDCMPFDLQSGDYEKNQILPGHES